MLKLLTLGTFFPEANSKAVPAIHFFGFPGAFDVRIFPDVLFVWHKKYFEKKRVKIELGTPNLSIHIFFLGGLCVYIYILFSKKYQYIYIYFYICTVCPTLLGCYALSTCDSIPAGKKSKQKKSKVHLPTFIPLHYTNKQLRHT